MAVAVVSYNTRELLRACLESVDAEGAAEVVVADNASTDGSPDLVRAEHPRATLLSNRANPGFGAAANQAVAACTAPYVLLLNADTRLEAGALAALTDHLDRHPGAAVVGPRLVNPDGTLQPSCNHFPTPVHAVLVRTAAGRLLARTPLVRRAYLPGWSHDRPRAVPWLKGAALALRREAFEQVGGFDPGFFVYFEEVDLCYRLAEAGWEVHFTPAARVMHVEGASTVQHRSDTTLRWFANAERFYHRHWSAGRLRRLRLGLGAVLLQKTVRDTLLLRRAGDPERRRRLAEDLGTWRRALRDVRGGAAARRPDAPPGSHDAPASAAGPPDLLRRADWRYLLPRSEHGGFRHLVVLGGPAALPELLTELGVARRVDGRLPADGDPPDAIAVLHDAGVDPSAAAARLAPDGAFYCEMDRRAAGRPGPSPAGLRAALEARGLRTTGVYAVRPGFAAPAAWLPLDAGGAMRWYLDSAHAAWSPRRRLFEAALRAGTRLGAGIRAGVWPCYAVTASAGSSGDLPIVLGLPVLPPGAGGRGVRTLMLAPGADRVVLLPFASRGAAPELVLKVPRTPAFETRTENEQTALGAIRGRLDDDLAPTLPRPLGIVRDGGLTVALETPLPGASLVRSSGRWGTSRARKLRDLRLSAAWIAAFHRATEVRRPAWDAASEWLETPLSRYAEAFGVPGNEAALFEAARRRSRELAGTPLPLVWRHRDFNAWNVLRHGRQVGVVDWEGASIGPALCDLLHFTTHWNEIARRLPVDARRLAAFRRLFIGGAAEDAFDRAARTAISDYLRALAMEERFLPLLLVVTWTELAWSRFDQRRLGDPGCAPRADNPALEYVGVLALHARSLFA
jgi:GT2 family glycosyltransferase